MDLRKLKKLIDLVEESGIAELEVTEGEERVRIAKHYGTVAAPVQQYAIPAAMPPAAAGASAVRLDDDDDRLDQLVLLLAGFGLGLGHGLAHCCLCPHGANLVTGAPRAGQPAGPR